MLHTQPVVLQCETDNCTITMKTFNLSDTLFVTVMQRGATLLSTRLSGIASPADLTRCLASQLEGTAGMVNVSLRNSSQGWRHSYNLSF